MTSLLLSPSPSLQLRISVLVLLTPWIIPVFASVGLKTGKFDKVAKALAQ